MKEPDWDCYHEGFNAYMLFLETREKQVNPYNPTTQNKKWKSWNIGWSNAKLV